MSAALKPCPFCGGQCAIKWVDGKPWFFPVCTQCGARGLTYVAPHGATEDEAAAAWNARAFQKCASCGGSGLSLDSAGEPDTCGECRGNTVVPAPPSGWNEADTAPTDGSEFIACQRGHAAYVCQFWRGDFVSFDPDDGVVLRTFDLWQPMPVSPAKLGGLA